jgi:Bacterial Ig domain/RTX calcium-binding nonapeptide repeat (4 copies)/FG-GAP-like repeat
MQLLSFELGAAMTIITPHGPEFLVNTVTADSQAGGQTVQLAGGRFMVVWTGSFINDPNAYPSNTNFANADVRAQIFNADGSKFGGEFVVNTTTAGVQLFPTATHLSDGHVLVTWTDGIGPLFGGVTEPQASIRGREYDANGVAVSSEFVIANAVTNGLEYGVAATNDGGFVVTYQTGGASAANPPGNLVGQIFTTANVATGTQFIIDNTNPFITKPFVTVESDGDIIVAWQDQSGYLIARLSSIGVFQSSSQLPFGYDVRNILTLATGGYAVVGVHSTDVRAPTDIFAIFNSADGTLSRQVTLASLPANAQTNVTASPTSNGGIVASWLLEDGNDTIFNIAAQAFTPIGDPIGTPFAVNTTMTGNQNNPSIAQLTNGDFVIVFNDNSGTGGDTSGYAIRAQIFDINPVNQAPVAVNDRFVAALVGESYTADYLTDNDTDLDGNPLVVNAISNIQGGTVTFDFNTQSFQFTRNSPAGLVTFDYTISDGAGGTATANAKLLPSPDDVATVRGGINFVDFLANDYLVSRPDGYDFSFNFLQPVNGLGFGPTTMDETAQLYLGANYLFNQTGYAFLPVGQSIVTTVSYTVSNPVTHVIDHIASLNLTLEGWTQLGGIGADNLVGTVQADHLVGGTGAVNTLTGGAGDDWYTVSVAGDVIVENANEGFDSLWTALPTYILPQNVERLFYSGPVASAFVGIGNSADNFIGGLSGNDRLFGAGGNDILRGSGGDDRIFGGSGEDRAVYSTAVGAATVTRLANGTVRVTTTSEGTDFLRGVETLRFGFDSQNITAYAAHDGNGDGDSDILYYSNSSGSILNAGFQNGAFTQTNTLGDTGSSNWDVQASGDFNYDGTSDLVLKNAVSGQFYVWTLTNGVQTGGFNLGTIGTNWNIASTGDFNADGNHDLLWRDSNNGHIYVWTLDNAGHQTGGASLGVLGIDWTAGKAGDFDGDGDSDVLLRNSTTGQVYLYTMQNGAFAGGQSLGVFGANWGLAATGDFNGDAISDIALKNTTTGQFYLLLMNQDRSYTGSSLGIIGTDWNIATTGDYNKDATDDLIWRNVNTGQTYLWAMEDGHQAAIGSGSSGVFGSDAVIV